jgi:hypothetical protein
MWTDPAAIPLRRWIYGRHFIRKFASETVSHGGLGKSSLEMTEALAIVTGRDLLGVTPDQRVNVWYWNGEDPYDELQRRIMAAALHYGIDRSEFEGRLFVDTGRHARIVIAEQTKAGTIIRRPVVEAVTRTIRENDIGLLIIDPFVSCHAVPENDTAAIQMVATEWTEIADATNCAVELVHHSRKTGGAEVTVEDGRGAVALLAKVRSARVLNGMTKDDAARYGVDNRRAFFNVGNGKANLYVPADGLDWFRLVSVNLGNGPFGADGDSIGVVTAWNVPDPLAGVTGAHVEEVRRRLRTGRWREHVAARNWAGTVVADVLGLDIANKAQRAQVVALLKKWIASGALIVVEEPDENRDVRKWIQVPNDPNA